MKSYFLVSLISLLGCAVSGCNLNMGCTEVGCANGANESVSVALPGLAIKYAAALPLTIKACADGASCVTAAVSKDGADIKCELKSGPSSGNCFVEANGDVSIAVVLDAATGAKASVTVAVTVTDSASAKVLDASKSATMSSTTPNGPDCEPVCHDGSVSFTP